MDKISKKHRSWNMSRIKGKDTTTELRVRSVLHRMGYRFRLHRNDLPGKPDIVLAKYNQIIFVHGCYWHRHEGCKLAYTPKSRVDFWKVKFAENVERDRRNIIALEEAGWKIGIIWECETLSEETLSKTISKIIAGK